MRLACLVALISLVAVVAPGVLAAEVLPGQATALRPSHAAAVLVDVADFTRAPVTPEAGPTGEKPAGRVWLELYTSWGKLEPADGQYALEALEQALEKVSGGPEGVALVIDGSDGPRDEDINARRKAWQALLRQVARVAGPKVDWYVVDGLLQPGTDGASAAFEIKLSSVTLRAEDSGAGVVFGISGAGAVPVVEDAFRAAGDLEPYVDGLSLMAEPSGAEAALDVLKKVGLHYDPGASIWVTVPEPEGSGEELADAVLSRAVALYAEGADLVAFPRGTGAGPTPVDKVMQALTKHLPPGLGLSPRAGAGVDVDPAGPPLRWVRFFDEKNFREVIVYWSDRPVQSGQTASLLFDKTMRRGFRIVDPVTGIMRYARTTPVDDSRVKVEGPLSSRPRLILVTRQKFSPGFQKEIEEADVAGSHEITADEIIAAHQRWRTFQDDRLISVMRKSTINLRFRYALVTGTIDLTMNGNYFWDRQTGEEWTIEEKYINGVKLNWDKIPELPLITEEQVVQAPLDLNLDKRYRYVRDGEEPVEGRQCWRLRFEPLAKEGSLYKGRAWIDQKTGALVKVTTLQTNLKPPLISDEETQTFHPHPGPDGSEYWIPDVIDGQLIYTIQGQNLVVLRRIGFGPPKINEPGFYKARDAAYASKMQMLRQTGEGFKWLSRKDDGSREIKQKADQKQLFVLAGALEDESTDGVLPLAGVNYTDLDFLGKDMILNVFFAGVLANVSISDPGFLGTRWDLGLAVNARAFKATDKLFILGTEDKSQRVRDLSENVTFTAGYPLGNFLKLRGVLSWNYVNYGRADETAPDFVLPEDHSRTREALSLAFDRKGWGFIVRKDWFQRSKWNPWGPAGELIDAADAAAAKDYSTYSVSGQKSWFLPFFQKIEIFTKYQEGEDLDRFSKFDFGFFGSDRVRGFGGSGIRYDRGWLGQFQYSFNIQDVIRFDAVIDHARVHDIDLSDGYTSHTGVGIAANFVGPWRTLWRADVGYALKSDLKPVEGQTEFSLVVLRLW